MTQGIKQKSAIQPLDRLPHDPYRATELEKWPLDLLITRLD